VEQLQDVFDFVAAHLALFKPVARGNGAITAALGRPLAPKSLRFEIASYARVRRTHEARGAQRDPQVVVVQLRGPPRVIAVLRGQCRDRLGRQTREPPDVAPHLITQRPHGVSGLLGRVQPALDRRDAKAHVEPGERMSPGLSRQHGQRLVKFAGNRWCREQRSNDREAQPRPPISLR
jgi:hypothetical protein